MAEHEWNRQNASEKGKTRVKMANCESKWQNTSEKGKTRVNYTRPTMLFFEMSESDDFYQNLLETITTVPISRKQ